jgi:hypothetical protein
LFEEALRSFLCQGSTNFPHWRLVKRNVNQLMNKRKVKLICINCFSGVHHKKDNCDPASSAQAIDKGVKTHQTLLFPDRLGVEVRHGKRIKLKKGNGGWGDIRDRQLCLAFSTMNSSQPISIPIS